jgi:hypothetical protein
MAGFEADSSAPVKRRRQCMSLHACPQYHFGGVHKIERLPREGPAAAPIPKLTETRRRACIPLVVQRTFIS